MGALLQSDEPYGHLRIVSENGRRYDAEPSGFTMVQNRSVARHDLSLHALGLLVKLLRRRNGGTHLCCPSYEVLRKDCEHAGKMPSPRSIADWLRELAMARELAWVHTGRHSTYYFPGDAEFQSASDALVDSLTTTATVVVSPIATATVEQHYRSGSDTTTATVVKQEVINKTNSTRHSAPTERAAPGPKPATKVAATPKEPTPTVEAKPTGPKNVPPSKRAKADTPKVPNALGTVIDAIRAAGLPLVLEAGKDGKALAGLLAGSDATTDDVIACYIAIARGEYGDDYARRNLSISYVCGARCMTGYLNWKRHPSLPIRASPNGRPRVSTAADFAALADRLEAEGR